MSHVIALFVYEWVTLVITHMYFLSANQEVNPSTQAIDVLYV